MEFFSDQTFYKLREGDELAFSALRNAYRVPAFQFCFGLLKDEHDAEIVTQSVFDKLWQDRSTLGTMDHFRNHLFSNLKMEVFGKMKEYSSPTAQARFLDKMAG